MTKYLLAFDTSTDDIIISVAAFAYDERKMLSVTLQRHRAPRAANTQLLAYINRMLEQSGVAREQLAAVAVGITLGSYTGVRIGVATAKGIAQGLGIPLYGLTTDEQKLSPEHLLERFAEVYDFQTGDVGAVLPYYTQLSYAEAAEALQHPARYEGVGVSEGASGAGASGAGASGASAAVGAAIGGVGAGAADGDSGAGVDGPPADANMADSVTYRTLTPFDLDALCMLADEAACFNWTRQQYADELQSAKRVWVGAFAPVSYGSEHGFEHERKQLVGYCGATALLDEADLLQVAVHSDFRGKGVATQLFELLFECLRERGVRKLNLEVRVGNTAARALYDRLGFTQVATRADYYNNPREDALVLAVCVDGSAAAGSADGDSATTGDGDEDAGEGDDESSQQSLRNQNGQRGHSGSRDQQDQHGKNSQCGQNGQQGRGGHSGPRGQLLLGIETSCDETAVAVMSDRQLLSDVVASQVRFHARFGGVVPEIASRKHTEALVATVEEAMHQANQTARLPLVALTGIAVTDRPGLIGALVVGQAYAKGLAWALGIPVYGINHLEGHLYSCAIEGLEESIDLPTPFVALIVSGGHTILVHSPEPHRYETLGETLDDAAGEAFDKVAKVLGLGYPGGPILSKLAAGGNPQAIDFPRAMIHSKDYAFSLSGLKTAVITYIREEEAKSRELNIPDIAASFQQAIVDVQVAKTVRAVKEKGAKHFILAGGVAANTVLRDALVDALCKEDVQVHIPPLKYCGDNAVMIARTALARLRAENASAGKREARGYLQALPLTADASASGSLDL